MKRLMNIFTCIAIILMCLGYLFKLMHWPGAGPILVLSLGFLSLFYLPVYYIYKRKVLNNWKIRLTIGLGIFCLSAFILGVLFKIMHWPGAGPLLVVSMVFFSLLVLPAYSVYKFRRSESKAEKGMHIMGGISVAFITLGVIFKIMHWPGAGPSLIVGTFLLLCGCLPFFIRAHKNDSQRPEKLNRLYFAITIIGTLIIMTLNNASNSIINSFCLVDERINEGNKNFEARNNMIYSSFTGDTKNVDLDLLRQKIRKTHQLSDDLYNYIGRIKSELYQKTQKIRKEVADTFNLWRLEAKDNYDIPSMILIGNPENPREGNLSARELKNKITVFKMDILSMVDDSSKAEFGKIIGLSTVDILDENVEDYVSWESYYFDHVPIVTVVTLLSQLQMEVLYSESEIITYLNNKSYKLLAKSSK